MPLSSIKELIPIETGGRIARKGFVYQDHVAVQFLIDLIFREEILEIWIEGEDDIVLLWNKGGETTVEMIQVKSNDLESRWSVSKLFSFDLLPKSLARGRCEEDVLYRVITCTDVESSLGFLKYELEDNTRDNSTISALLNAHTDKVKETGINPKGENAYDWFTKCYWQVLPQLNALTAQNLIYLEKCLHENYNLIVSPDQRTEIYQQLLAFTSNAGVGSEKCNFSRQEIIELFDRVLKDLSAPRSGTERLVKKLTDAQVGLDTLESAKDFRWQFEKEALNFNFYGRTKINEFKNRVHTLIQTLKLDYDNGKLPFDDSEFHKYCWDHVKELANTAGVNEEIALGCMYDNTNRCTHRFTKARV